MKFINLIALLILTNFANGQKVSFKIPYEKFTLPNGLQVVFHIDRSDPVVAVSLTAHVGSAREKEGRTGFAHLFEHLLFLESENLGKGGLDKMTARIGGSGANGSTNRDRTNYLQTVPNDALEKMLWAEADKLGWFINTVTEPVLAKEKQVVKNEKRQSNDNVPYGHNSYVIDKHLYPADHPYNWQVIGSLEDLQNATLDYVKEFFRRWYVPNNVTLVVAGDFDPVMAKKWVNKYFAEIKRGEAVNNMQKRPGHVPQTVKLYHEDNFARLPQLTMAWPTVEQYHPDSYPLSVLAQYLTQGKKAPFYQVIVENKKLAANTSMFHRESELAGNMQLTIRAFADKDLDEVIAAVNEAFARFEKEGLSEKDLDRIKAGQERQFYNALSSVLGKGAVLAQYNIFAGDPGFVDKDINNILAVTPADVKRVYEKYIKGKNFVATSFVPKGKLDLALQDSKKADVVEEKITANDNEKVDPNVKATYEKTPSTFDRSKEPPYGSEPKLSIPAVWQTKLGNNNIRVSGIESKEVPLVQFEIVIDGGLLLENIEKVGVSNLMAQMMTQGTKNKTPQELEEAIQQLGASINAFAGVEDVRISVTTLAKNFQQTVELVKEILLEPRWDANEFERIKQSVISQLKQQEGEPNALAQKQFNELIYGRSNIRSRSTLGNAASVNSVTLDDLKSYYANNISPNVARIQVVSALDKTTITAAFDQLAANWKPKKVEIPAWPVAKESVGAKVYFYDVPDAKQSVLRFGYPALAVTDPDFYPATVMNYILGGGGFASQLTQQLREGKGYTYGINSGFQGTEAVGPFTISSGVRSNVTYEATQLIKNIVEGYAGNYTENDLATTKSFLIKSNARAFETSGAKLNLLDNISKYNWSPDYILEREKIVKNMTVEKIRALSKKYLDASKMVWLVVGDAKTQLEPLKKLGVGDPVILNQPARGF
jgi:zinc protease